MREGLLAAEVLAVAVAPAVGDAAAQRCQPACELDWKRQSGRDDRPREDEHEWREDEVSGGSHLTPLVEAGPAQRVLVALLGVGRTTEVGIAERSTPVRFLIRDHDSKFTRDFDIVFRTRDLIGI